MLLKWKIEKENGLVPTVFTTDWIDIGVHIHQNCPSFKSDINDYSKFDK